MNSRHKPLPFDVLCNVFRYYRATLGSPLETLLLVCRLWTEAALKSHEIWSDIDIYIYNECMASFWSRQVPRRLSRSGATSSIYFSLRARRFREICDDDCDCGCYEPAEMQAQIKRIFKAIIGPDGHFCSRWREVVLDFDWREPYAFPDDIPFFSYPTPNLRVLRLDEVRYSGVKSKVTFLPLVPLLREAYINFCYIPSLPSTQNLSVLEVKDSGGDPDEWWGIASLTNLSQAKNLHILRLRVGIPGDPFFLPHRLSYLTQLSLGGQQVPSNIGDVEVPNLKELRLTFEFCDSHHDSTMQFVNCKNIPFSQITTLAIEPDGYHRAHCSFVWIAYGDLLRKCCNARHIVGNIFSAPFLLKLLKVNCEEKEGSGVNQQSGIIDHTITFSNEIWQRELRSGRRRRLRNIHKLASDRGWNLDLPRNSFLKEWNRILDVSAR